MPVHDADIAAVFSEIADLLEIHCRMARDEGVMVSIGSDAHSIYEYAYLNYGVSQARRGWLSAGDVVNTRPLPALRRLIRRAR